MNKAIETIITGIIASYTTGKITECIIEEKEKKNIKNIIIWLISGLIIAISYMTIHNFL